MDTDEARAVDMQPERDVDHGCLLDGSRGVNPLDVPAPETSGTSYKMLVERTGATDVLDDDRQIAAVARLLDVHDHHVPGYSKRLAEWAEALARALSCSAKELEAICRAALLHGIGKIDVPETTLKKSARLNDREHTMLRNQPVVAYRMLHDIAGLGAVATLLRHRFEHWDGTGHPDGLKGDAIPVGARILAVVEAYGEMVIGRPGAPKLYFRDAIAALRGEAGTQFDPEVAEAFCAIALESGRDAIKQG